MRKHPHCNILYKNSVSWGEGAERKRSKLEKLKRVKHSLSRHTSGSSCRRIVKFKAKAGLQARLS
jgi:hypothetical protein